MILISIFMWEKYNKFGFSIIGLLLIFAIIITVVAGSVFIFRNKMEKIKIAEFKEQMNNDSSYIESCLSDNGTLFDSQNNDMIIDHGGEMCSYFGHGKYAAPKERMDCDGEGVYGIFVTSELDGIEAVCNLSNNRKCVAVCTSRGCSFTGDCN
jgi:hypothetical protein